MTVQDVIEFVHAQRAIRGEHKVLRNWSDGSIALSIVHAIERGGFGCVVTNGKLTGFCFGMPRHTERVFDVTQIVCASPRDLAHLLLLFEGSFRGWTLRGFRRKKVESKSLVDYKRIQRLSHLSQLTASNYVSI